MTEHKITGSSVVNAGGSIAPVDKKRFDVSSIIKQIVKKGQEERMKGTKGGVW